MTDCIGPAAHAFALAPIWIWPPGAEPVQPQEIHVLFVFKADSHNQGLAVYKTAIAIPRCRRRDRRYCACCGFDCGGAGERRPVPHAHIRASPPCIKKLPSVLMHFAFLKQTGPTMGRLPCASLKNTNVGKKRGDRRPPPAQHLCLRGAVNECKADHV